VTTLSPQRRGTRTVRKITRKRIDTALEALSNKTLSAEGVHQARKALKKARAGLRMLRPGVKEAAYREVNEALRDAARPLSAARDAQVLGDTLSALVKRYGAPARHLQLAALRRAIAHHRADTHGSLLAKTGTIAHSRGLLREARGRVKALGLHSHDWDVLGSGLKRVYSGCKRSMTHATENGACDAAFHEWRKQVKYLRYELAMLEPLWPALIDTLIDQAHRLSDYLGQDHDLTVLREMAVTHRGELSDRALEALMALVERRQEELRQKATRLGSRLFEEKPKRFMARLEDYWRQWRREPLDA
jgi:CHAD domain-containing protein